MPSYVGRPSIHTALVPRRPPIIVVLRRSRWTYRNKDRNISLRRHLCTHNGRTGPSGAKKPYPIPYDWHVMEPGCPGSPCGFSRTRSRIFSVLRYNTVSVDQYCTTNERSTQLELRLSSSSGGRWHTGGNTYPNPPAVRDAARTRKGEINRRLC